MTNQVNNEPLAWLRKNVKNSGNKNLQTLTELIENDGDVSSQIDFLTQAKKTAKLVKLLIKLLEKNFATVTIEDILEWIPLDEIRDQLLKAIIPLNIPSAKSVKRNVKMILKQLLELILEKKTFICLAIITCTISNFFFTFQEVKNASNVLEKSKKSIKNVEKQIQKLDEDLLSLLELKKKYNVETDASKKRIFADKISYDIAIVLDHHRQAAEELSKVEVVINGEIQSLNFSKDTCMVFAGVSLGLGLAAGAVAAASAHPVIALTTVGLCALGAAYALGHALTIEKLDELKQKLETIKKFQYSLKMIEQKLKEIKIWLDEVMKDLYGI